MMTVPERVAKFLRESGGTAYCDGCIQRMLGLARVQQVQQITSSFALAGGFARENGICSTCNEDKKVIRALT
jgi:hypothetical protein